MPLPDQWEFLKTVKRYSVQEIDYVYQDLFTQNESLLKASTRASGVLSISVGNKIVFARSEIISDLKDFFERKLNFLNTECLQKRRLGNRRTRYKNTLSSFEESEDVISLPRGFLGQLVTFLKEHNIAHEIRYDRPLLTGVSFKSSIQLTPSQTKVLDSAMEGDQGCDRCAIWKRQNYYWIRTRRAKKSFNIDSCPPQTAIGPVGRTNSDIPWHTEGSYRSILRAKKDIGKQSQLACFKASLE